MNDRVSLYPGRVTLTPVEGQPNTYDMVRADQPTQAGTALSKANLLKDTTAAQFGLDSNAVPDDVLSWVGKYNEYWWNTRINVDNGAYILGIVDTSVGSNYFGIMYAPKQSGARTLTYSSQVMCDPVTGKLTMVDPKTMTSAGKSDSYKFDNIDALKGTFVLGCYDLSDYMVYISEDATIDQVSTSYGYTYRISILSSMMPVATAVWNSQITLGEWEYVHSVDPEAFPHSGIVSGVEYVYLGSPFEKFPTMPQIETGSYTGTGVKGDSNPNSLTFNIVPQFLMIFTSMGAPNTSSKGQLILLPQGLTTTFSSGLRSIMGGYVDSLYGKKSDDGKTVSWYWTGDSSVGQFNYKAIKYHYFAIG